MIVINGRFKGGKFISKEQEKALLLYLNDNMPIDEAQKNKISQMIEIEYFQKYSKKVMDETERIIFRISRDS